MTTLPLASLTSTTMIECGLTSCSSTTVPETVVRPSSVPPGIPMMSGDRPRHQDQDSGKSCGSKR